MDVGNDPFPRDEVTGLAAFENLEPVSALNVMPEPPPPEPVAPQAPRTFNRPIGVAPVPAAHGGGDMDRADRTEILNLDKVEHVTDEEARSGGGWEDDAATAFFSPAAFSTTAATDYGHGDHDAPAVPPAASLDMDWDEEEPPTRMRDDLPFLPPLGGSARGGTADWDEEAHPQPIERFDDLATAGYAPVGDMPASPPVGRPSPFPPPGANNGRAYLAPLAQVADRGGAPSPFSATGELPGARSRPAWMLVAAGAGVAVALFLIGRLVIGGSAPASVTLTTAPIDARVFVDGKPVSGSSSPYSASELAAGQHELVVQKEGFGEYRSTFTVESGASHTLPLVQLSRNGGDTGFAVNSMPSGADISIDGSPIGKTTPAKVTGVVPGVHKLELKLAGHTDFELQVLVPDTGVLQLPTAELAEADSGRARAEARAEARSEARERRDREPREEPLTPIVNDEPRPRRERAPKAEPVPVAARLEPAPAAAPRGGGGAGGMLRLNSRPWSQVYVDGRLVGNTPQMGLPLSAGNHSIRLVNAQMGLTKTFSISVKTGQMVTKVVNLVE